MYFLSISVGKKGLRKKEEEEEENLEICH